MATLRELITKIGFEVDEAGARGAEDRVKGMSLKMKGVLLAVAAAVAKIGWEAINVAADMEMMTTQFEVMLGSAEAAVDLMEELKAFAAGTPFALEDLAAGTQQLLSFGVAQEDVIDVMKMLGDTAGGNAEKLSGLVLAYGKVTTKGKASLEEINMMAERGLPIFDILSKHMGVSKEELFKLISAGKVAATDVTAAFRTMTEEGGMFFRGMEKQSLTFAGIRSTLEDNLKMVLADIGAFLLPGLKEVMGDAITFIQGPFGTFISGLMSVVAPVFNIIITILRAVFKILGPIFKAVGSILGFVGRIVDFIANRINKGLNNTATVLGTVAMILNKIIQFFIRLFTVTSRISEIIFLIIRYIGQNLLNAVIKVAEAIWNKIFMRLKTGFDNVLTWIGNIKAFVKEVIDFVADIVRQFWDWLLGRFPGLATVIGKIGDVFTAMWRSVRDVFQTIWDGITGGIQKLIGWVNKIPGVDFQLPTFEGGGAAEGRGAEVTTGQGLLDFLAGRTPEFSPAVTEAGRTAQVNMENNIVVSVPEGANTEGIKSAVEDAARAVFSIEIQKVLVNAGY